MKHLLLSLTIFLLLTASCSGGQPVKRTEENHNAAERGSGTLAAKDQASLFLAAPAKLASVELTPEVIPVWRKHREDKPALVIFSNNPMLGTIPQGLRPKVAQLVEQGNASDFRRQARVRVANPILLPAQTLSATLQAGFFSQVLWVFPTAGTEDKISLDVFRQQLIESGTLQAEEAATLTSENGIFRGQLKGIPFLACSIRTLPRLAGPVILHLDLSYFSASYENEISTPIFSLAHNTLVAIRQAGWPAIGASLSLSNREGDVPLELRFLKDVLVKSFEDPTLLDQPLPELWALRKEARYLETFFQIDSVLESYQAMASKTFGDASVQFDLYRALWMNKAYVEALEHLDRAGSLESAYGLEYLNLVYQAMEESNTEAAMDLLTKASRLDPENPFIQLQMVEIYTQTGKEAKARPLIDSLRKRKWSAIYYPEIPALLTGLETRARKAMAK